MGKLSLEYLVNKKYHKSVKDILQGFADNDYTCQMAAKDLECSVSAISVHAKKNGIIFKSLSPKERSKAKAPKEINHLDAQVSMLLSKSWV